MKAFLWAVGVYLLMRMLFMLGYLAREDYPRRPSYGRGDDALSVLVSMTLAVWAIILLLR